MEFSVCVNESRVVLEMLKILGILILDVCVLKRACK